MADKTKKQPENVPGKYYVCTDCTACASCAGFAPNNFKLADDASHAYVFKQPENEQEETESKEAMESCPSQAIGDDGETE